LLRKKDKFAIFNPILLKEAMIKNKWSHKTCFILTIFFVCLNSANCFSSTEISNVRYWAAPDHTRIVFDLDSEPVFEVKENGKILVLKFTAATFNKSIPAEIILSKPGIKKINFYTTKNNTVKIEFVLDKHLKTDVFKLKKFQDKPQRVVIDIILDLPAQQQMINDHLPKLTAKKIIVIDPGHGGEDPGAVGKRGTYEKNIVLVIGREIKKAVNKLPGYRAVLTRDGDYYVPFDKRLQIAKDLGASLFISIHADAARNRAAKGSSVYCLSTGAASSEAAKLMANNENLSDIIGGVQSGEGKNESDQIVLNMFQTNTINLSKTYAGTLITHLDRVNSLKHKKVQEAPFKVLKLPDIPAVLIETAYISNMQEENLLKTDGFQKKLAMAVASSVTEYVGRKILVPAISAEKTPERNGGRGKQNGGINTSKIYTVKKGDTLFSLAKNNSTTVDELRRINNMRSADGLLYGQRIKLP
jgi:N-acetylmuramoyl-L-alanine amidase